MDWRRNSRLFYFNESRKVKEEMDVGWTLRLWTSSSAQRGAWLGRLIGVLSCPFPNPLRKRFKRVE